MRRLLRYRFRRTTIMLAGFLSCLGGLGLAKLSPTLPVYAVCTVLCICSLAACRRWPVALLVCAVCLGLVAGYWRGAMYDRQLAVWNDWYDTTVTLDVRVADDAVYGTHSQLTFTGEQVVLPDGQAVRGKLQVSGFGINAAFQGDEVLATGKLRTGYGSLIGVMSYAKLEMVGPHPSAIASLRRRFSGGMESALPEPDASFAMGLLIGQRSGLPDTVKRDLLMVGLTHIIAVSGYNLTIILRATKKLAAGQSKRLSLLLAIGLIGTFLLITGSSASIVRAAIVSMLSIMAGYYGRTFPPLNLISLAAVITAWANPLYVWSDASWYLSFLAFFGVMVLAPGIAAKLPKRIGESLLGGIAIESICAEMMTLPYILHTFGQMSFIGLLANVLVVALIPLGMLLSLVAGLAGMFGELTGWLALPARWLLTYMLDIAHLLAHVPHIFIENIGMSVAQMLIAYTAVVSLSAVLWQQTKRTTHDKITDNDSSKPEVPTGRSRHSERTQQMVNH